MQKFKFAYTELWSKELEIEADSEQAAYEKAHEMAVEGLDIDQEKDRFIEWTVEYI